VAVALHDLAEHVTRLDALDNIIKGIPAGIIIVALVWLSPGTRYFRFFAITFFIYFIALGEFAHVVVGSCEMAYEVIAGEADFMEYFFRFLLPTGLGNVIGGTGIFTILIYNQIKGDLSYQAK
jgi:formate/nitrite transporter FocA (FNT family)